MTRSAFSVAKQRLITGTLLIVLVCAVFALTPASASAAPNIHMQPATTCYGGAISFQRNVPYDGYTQLGPYTTTSRCNDINLKITSGGGEQGVSACVVFIKHTDLCNYQTIFGPGDWSWKTIATDVLDGTSFTVILFLGDSQPYTGLLAF